MPQKSLTTPYPLIDADPHAFRVVRYMRPSDYVWWSAGTVAFPSAYYLWSKSLSIVIYRLNPADLADPSVGVQTTMRSALKLCGTLGFVGGFLFAYQSSSSQLNPRSTSSYL